MSIEPLKIAVVIASLGRPDNLFALLGRLAVQSQLPVRVVLSLESESDAPAYGQWPFPVTVIYGPRGSCIQRNRGLDMIGPEADIVVIYDDDFVPSRYSIAGLAEFYRAHPDVAGADGLVLRDGINSPGFSIPQATKIVEAADEKGPPSPKILGERHGLYGCNMSYRLKDIEGIRFDENLPLYAWLEDLDFGGRIGKRLVRTNAFYGVHCGEKRGREKNGRKLGYSQVVNPVYMIGKKTIPLPIALKLIARTTLKNHLRALHPEPWIDRKGRLIGNWIALRDILLKRADPSNITRM